MTIDRLLEDVLLDLLDFYVDEGQSRHKKDLRW
jgi:hypothetical protein